MALVNMRPAEGFAEICRGMAGVRFVSVVAIYFEEVRPATGRRSIGSRAEQERHRAVGAQAGYASVTLFPGRSTARERVGMMETVRLWRVLRILRPECIAMFYTKPSFSRSVRLVGRSLGVPAIVVGLQGREADSAKERGYSRERGAYGDSWYRGLGAEGDTFGDPSRPVQAGQDENAGRYSELCARERSYVRLNVDERRKRRVDALNVVATAVARLNVSGALRQV